MMPIRMKHKYHGFHNAYNEQEVESLKLSGWAIEDELQPLLADKLVTSMETNQPSFSATPSQEPKKRGPKPKAK